MKRNIFILILFIPVLKTIREIQSLSNTFSLKEDGIIEIQPIPGWNDTPRLEHAIKDMECLALLNEGTLYPNLCFLADAMINREIREYYANHVPLSIGSALIVRSSFQRILGNFFIGLNKVKVPIRLFTDASEARIWLLKLKQKNE
ncbi:MAG: hypothetical protein ACHQRM_09270 [Bacteroidia bacterium]